MERVFLFNFFSVAKAVSGRNRAILWRSVRNCSHGSAAVSERIELDTNPTIRMFRNISIRIWCISGTVVRMGRERASVLEIINPSPANEELETLDFSPGTRDSRLETRDLRLETQDSRLETGASRHSYYFRDGRVHAWCPVLNHLRAPHTLDSNVPSRSHPDFLNKILKPPRIRKSLPESSNDRMEIRGEFDQESVQKLDQFGPENSLNPIFGSAEI